MHLSIIFNYFKELNRHNPYRDKSENKSRAHNSLGSTTYLTLAGSSRKGPEGKRARDCPCRKVINGT